MNALSVRVKKSDQLPQAFPQSLEDDFMGQNPGISERGPTLDKVQSPRVQSGRQG